MQCFDSLGDARVLVKDQLWWYNAECLSLTTRRSENQSEELNLGTLIEVLVLIPLLKCA